MMRPGDHSDLRARIVMLNEAWPERTKGAASRWGIVITDDER